MRNLCIIIMIFRARFGADEYLASTDLGGDGSLTSNLGSDGTCSWLGSAGVTTLFDHLSLPLEDLGILHLGLRIFLKGSFSTGILFPLPLPLVIGILCKRHLYQLQNIRLERMNFRDCKCLMGIQLGQLLLMIGRFRLEEW